MSISRGNHPCKLLSAAGRRKGSLPRPRRANATRQAAAHAERPQIRGLSRRWALCAERSAHNSSGAADGTSRHARTSAPLVGLLRPRRPARTKRWRVLGATVPLPAQWGRRRARELACTHVEGRTARHAAPLARARAAGAPARRSSAPGTRPSPVRGWARGRLRRAWSHVPPVLRRRLLSQTLNRDEPTIQALNSQPLWPWASLGVAPQPLSHGLNALVSTPEVNHTASTAAGARAAGQHAAKRWRSEVGRHVAAPAAALAAAQSSSGFDGTPVASGSSAVSPRPGRVRLFRRALGRGRDPPQTRRGGCARAVQSCLATATTRASGLPPRRRVRAAPTSSYAYIRRGATRHGTMPHRDDRVWCERC